MAPATEEDRSEVDVMQLEGCSNLDLSLKLPETSPAGIDQVLWRDNEKTGERRESHQAKPSPAITNVEACNKVRLRKTEPHSCITSNLGDEVNYIRLGKLIKHS